MVDGAPKIVGLASNLYENFIDMPAPNRIAALLEAAFSYFRREQGTKTVPPMAHTFMAYIDATLVQQVFDIAKQEQIPKLQIKLKVNILFLLQI